ncbi:MAG: alpha/beta hydrolase family protein [Dysgonomonas sp.]
MKSVLIKIVFTMALVTFAGIIAQAQPYTGITNPITSVYPVKFKPSYRMVNLEVKVTAPVKGENLPVILISHGHGAPWYLASYRGMSPLADYYASNGFVVIQPSHQDSRILGLDKNGPEGALFWKSRVEDMIFCIDHIDELLSYIPGLTQRTDKDKIAAVGFSMGGHTISMLAGAIT